MSVTITTIHNPFNELENSIESREFVPDRNLLFYLPDLVTRCHVSYVVAVNGRVVEAAFENVLVMDNDYIAVSARVDGMLAGAIAAWATAGMSAGIMATIAYGLVYAGSMLAIGYGMSMLASALGPSTPSGTTTGTDIEQTYGWDSVSPALTEGNPIPLIFGTNKLAGQVINEYVETVGNDQHLYSLMALCDHEVDSITDIEINGQPASYYQDVTTATGLGTLSDTVIDGFNEIVEQKNYGDVLEKDTEVIKQTDGNSVEKIVVHIVAPSGLYYSNDSGGLDERSAEFLIKYRAVGDTTWISVGSYSITDKTTETVRNKYEIDPLTPDKYEVQITRTNDEESSFRGNNEIQLYSVQEIIKESLIYPGLAKYAVKALATGQLSGSRPAYTCLATLSTVQVHDGSSWVSKAATNQAWITYSLMTLLVPYTRLIYSEFLAWATHCDEDLGDGEKRFVLARVVNQAASLWDTVQEIARIADASIVRKGTKYGVFVDKQETTVSHLFSMGNIIDDTFSISYVAKKDRANCVEVEYTDPDKDYSRQVVTVMSDDYNDTTTYSKKATIKVNGSIPYNQAVRMAVKQVNDNKYINRIVNFEADIDSFACTLGDLFYFMHEVPDYENGSSGRIEAATSNTVTLDREVTIEASTSYSIVIRLQDDTIVEKTVTNAVGTTDTLTLGSSFSTTPVAFDSVYMFGVTTLIKKKYRLTNISRANDFTRALTGMEYIGEIYTEGSTTVIENPSWDTTVQEAVNVRLQEILVWGKNGSYASQVMASWHPAHSARSQNWAVWIRDTSTSQAAFKVAVVSALHHIVSSVSLVVGHTYRVTICRDGDGFYETSNGDDNDNYTDITLAGKLAPPSDVSGFVGTFNSLTRSVNLAWTHVSDIDFDHYEIRQKTTATAGWDAAAQVAKTVDKGKSFLMDNNTDETLTYYIKAVDDSGILSENEAEVGVAVDTSLTPLTVPTGLTVTSSAVFTASGEQVVTMRISWDELVADDLLKYAIRIERQLGSNAAGHASNPVETYTTDEILFDYAAMPSTKYWIAVRAIDTSSGWTAWSSQVEHTTCLDEDAPDTPDWSTTVDIVPGFKCIAINWQDSTAEDLSHYVVQRSTTGAFSGEESTLGDIRASFVSDTDLDVDTLYYYRVKAVDTSGNSSGWSTTKSATTLQVGSTDIAYNAILANHIYVTNLSAISANLGTIVAGIIQNAATDPTSWMDLANATMSLGGRLTWDGSRLLVNGWNSDTDFIKFDGGAIDVSSKIQIGNADGQSDFCLIDSGEIIFARYFSGIGHKMVRSLKQITMGSCENDDTVTLPGYWANKPVIHVSPKRIKTFDASQSAYDQEILCPDPEAVSSGTGQWEFTATAKLVLSNGSASTIINEVGNNSSSPTDTGAQTAEHTVAESNTVAMDLTIDVSGYTLSYHTTGNADRGYYHFCKRYQIKVTVETRYYTDSAWTDWSDHSRGAEWLIASAEQKKRYVLPIQVTSPDDITKIQARMTYSDVADAGSPFDSFVVASESSTLASNYYSKREIEIVSYQSVLSGYETPLDEGELNYIAIEGNGDITGTYDTTGSAGIAAGILVMQVGNPAEQIEKDGFSSTSAADEADTPGMVDDDIFIQYVE